MALKLNIAVCSKSNCKKFEFVELTGEYDLVDNLTGWETPNPTIAGVNSAILEVYKPGFTSTSIADETFDLHAESPAWPTTDTTQIFTITNNDLGYSGKVEDGIWKFVYIVEVENVVYKQTIYIATTCNIKCCVDNLFAAIEDFECDCMETQIDKALTAQAIFKAMESAANCSNITKFNKLKSMLQRMCTNTNCCD